MLIQYVTGPINTNAYKKKNVFVTILSGRGNIKRHIWFELLKKKKFTKVEKKTIMKYKKQWLSLGGVITLGFSFFFLQFSIISVGFFSKMYTQTPEIKLPLTWWLSTESKFLNYWSLPLKLRKKPQLQIGILQTAKHCINGCYKLFFHLPSVCKHENCWH